MSEVVDPFVPVEPAYTVRPDVTPEMFADFSAEDYARAVVNEALTPVIAALVRPAVVQWAENAAWAATAEGMCYAADMTLAMHELDAQRAAAEADRRAAFERLRCDSDHTDAVERYRANKQVSGDAQPSYVVGLPGPDETDIMDTDPDTYDSDIKNGLAGNLDPETRAMFWSARACHETDNGAPVTHDEYLHFWGTGGKSPFEQQLL